MASTPTRDLQEEFLAATRKSQETVVRAINTWFETVRAVTPKLPSVYVPLADRLPRMPSVTMPFAGKLPTPEDVVANGYDFAEHLLALQRKFAEDLLSATEPLLPVNARPTVTAKPPVPEVPAASKLAPAASKPAASKAAPKPASARPAAPKAESTPAAPKAKPATVKPVTPRRTPKNTER